MHKKTIPVVLAFLCLYANSFSQKINIQPYYIGDRVPDLPLTNIIHYKDSIANLSSFGHKLTILDFWGVHCTTCIAMFPKEDSLQKQLNHQVQFILVTYDNRQSVDRFFTRWDSIHHPLSLPVAVKDRLFNKLFRFHYIPHYVWIAPDGHVLAQTSETQINRESILNTVRWIKENEARLKADKYPADMFRLPELDPGKLQILKSIKE